MARKRKKKKRRLSVERETLWSIIAIALIVLAIFLTLAWLGQAGLVGDYTYRGLSLLLGIGYFLLPILAVLVAIRIFRDEDDEYHFGGTQIFGAILFVLSGLGLIDLLFDSKAGLIGEWVTLPLVALFANYVSGIVLAALLLISLFITFNLTLQHLRALLQRREKEVYADEPDIYDPDEEQYEDEVDDEEDEEEPDDEVGDEEAKPEKKKSKLFGGIGKGRDEDALEIATLTPANTQPYTPPPLSLLQQKSGKARAGDVKANANIIRRTLANFGIDIEIEEITVGPSITRYAIKPAEGVRLARIVSLQNNLELALAAHPVRIEAPIPGKSLVGIEVPNSAKSTVGLASLINSPEFKEYTKPLAAAVGRTVTGSVLTAAVSSMPHMLIAGATGAGKSVMIHTIVTSLLYRNSPQHLKLIMIDPKRVELTLYSGIPHLLTPVITDAKKAVLAMKWLITEMERRYDILQDYQVRDIASYHANVVRPALENGAEDEEEMPDALPYIVLIVDELADLMSAYPRELEASIVRIAQMSRAVGIHLILSTQRPSVNVITGLIKANIPARIALQVASQIDSRTILDMAGAEKLLGAGDMLYVSGEMSKPVRLQSGFISEEEVKKVTKFLSKHHDAPDEEELTLTEDGIAGALDTDDFDDDEEDDLYEEARETVIAAGKASTSYLQRKLRIGYSRAARLIDMLEDRGVVGEQDGSRAREILVPEPDEEYEDEMEEEEA